MQKFLIMLLLTVFAAGCASTQNPSNVSQLQIKVNQMERRLADREREIEELKFMVNNLSANMEDSNDVSFKSPIEDIDLSALELEKEREVSDAPAKNTSIVRVNESSQRIQAALKSAGYYNGAIDGKIGSGSRQAIRDFQRDHNLKIDGIIGKNTWNELKNYLD